MITYERYIEITGDDATASATVEHCITDAVDALEDYLDRPLAEGERTETLNPDRRGRLWPRATPILTATGYTIEGLSLAGPFGPAVSLLGGTVAVEVTYTGGWADPTAVGFDPDAANQLPSCIQRDLAWAAYKLARPAADQQAAGIIAGATSVRLGDAAITGPRLGGASSLDTFWSKRTRGYRYAPIHTTPEWAYA